MKFKLTPSSPYIHFFGPQLTPYNILQNLTTNWVGVRLPPTYIFGDPLLTPTYIFNFIPTPPPDQKWNSPSLQNPAGEPTDSHNSSKS